MTGRLDGEERLDALKRRVQDFCLARDWDQFHGAKDLAIGVATEAAELLEIFRFQTQAQCAQLLADPQAREAIGDELADVLFFILRFAARFDFDLSAALERKIEKNARKYPVEKSRGNNRKYTSL
jgi:NTP pyrophosphatase (non-canonical NTP hydrolase)